MILALVFCGCAESQGANLFLEDPVLKAYGRVEINGGMNAGGVTRIEW